MTDLSRRLTFFDGATLLVGSVIGSGIFVVPSLIAQRVPEPGLAIGIWIFSGLLVLCGALTLAELGAMLPESGGLYVYMREAYGPFWAFLYGWTIMLVVIPGAVAALTTAFLLYLQLFIPMSVAVEKAVPLPAAGPPGGGGRHLPGGPGARARQPGRPRRAGGPGGR
jgi:APA family basic amino acid/polyamine antiporter